jgi:chemotaxis protein methyltransferase CheR
MMNVVPSYSAPILTKPQTMSDITFRELREFIYQKTGIYFQDNKKYLLESRISKRLQLLRLDKFEEYLDFLKFGVGREEEKKYLYDAITINETYFFRNEPQFEILEKTLIPEILKLKQTAGKNKIRIWSSASSSGEEAHTIAMIFLERIKPKFPMMELEVVGTDISPSVLETARRGIYREYSVRNMPKYYLEKYFTNSEGRFTVLDSVRKMVRFDHMNLYDQSRMRMMTNFDVVFCCNVLIYFDAKSKIQVVSNLYDSLNRGGYLFIGYAESLHGISTAFKVINFPKAITYKKE